MSWPDSQLPFDLEDMEVAGDSRFAVAFPVDMPEEFKRRVFAAGKSYVAGLSSVDYTLRRYGQGWQFPPTETESDRVVLKLCRLVRSTAGYVIDYLGRIPEKPDIASIFACTAAIYRLRSTFRGAVLCIRNGLHFEAVTLARLILEQIAWMSSIHRMTGDADAFTRVNPQACIGSLKALIPESGRIYGELREASHLHFDVTLDYIKVHEGDLAIFSHDMELAAADAVRLLVLLDWLGIVGEYVYSAQLTKPKYTELTALGQRVPLATRHTLQAISEGHALLATLAESAA